MSFVCSSCNTGSSKTVFTKAGRCTFTIQSRRKAGLVQCTGIVCGKCGVCQREWEHRS